MQNLGKVLLAVALIAVTYDVIVRMTNKDTIQPLSGSVLGSASNKTYTCKMVCTEDVAAPKPSPRPAPRPSPRPSPRPALSCSTALRSVYEKCVASSDKTSTSCVTAIQNCKNAPRPAPRPAVKPAPRPAVKPAPRPTVKPAVEQYFPITPLATGRGDVNPKTGLPMC